MDAAGPGNLCGCQPPTSVLHSAACFHAP